MKNNRSPSKYITLLGRHEFEIEPYLIKKAERLNEELGKNDYFHYFNELMTYLDSPLRRNQIEIEEFMNKERIFELESLFEKLGVQNTRRAMNNLLTWWIGYSRRDEYHDFALFYLLLKLKLDNTTTKIMNITAQNYATETAKLDLSSLSKEQQNFHALVLPHIVRFDKDISQDKNKEVQTKLTAYYNFLSVKLQGKASPQDDEKVKLFQFRKRKQLQLALAANANK